MVTVQGSEARFQFFRPGATEVHLAGDFNCWQVGQLRMCRGADGYWRASLRLPEGSYRFGYVADGRWYADYAAFGVEPGLHGLEGVLRIASASAASGREGGVS